MTKSLKPTLACFFLFSSIKALAICTPSLPPSSPGFCESFKVAAICHCTQTWGLPQRMCQDMNKLYSRMMASFGSLQRACEYQHDTTTQECIDDWNCYRRGGMTSDGQLCGGTGRACA